MPLIATGWRCDCDFCDASFPPQDAPLASVLDMLESAGWVLYEFDEDDNPNDAMVYCPTCKREHDLEG